MMAAMCLILILIVIPLRVDDLVYVNSWTKDIEESKEMWKTYAPY